MRRPQFVRLAQIDAQRFITACRHKLVHLTWRRTTVRFAEDEFRQLAGLLTRSMDGSPPFSARERNLYVAYREDEECEVRIESLAMLLPPKEFDELVQAVREAVEHLDKILASGSWGEEEASESPPSSLPHIRRTPFSRN